MPRPKKKDPKEWTADDAIERLFPKKVRERVKEATEKPPKPQVTPPEPSIKEDDT